MRNRLKMISSQTWWDILSCVVAALGFIAVFGLLFFAEHLFT